MAKAKGISMVSVEYSLNTQTFSFSDCDDRYFALPNITKHGSSISVKVYELIQELSWKEIHFHNLQDLYKKKNLLVTFTN